MGPGMTDIPRILVQTRGPFICTECGQEIKCTAAFGGPLRCYACSCEFWAKSRAITRLPDARKAEQR
jgi:hypothetical protein